MKQHEETRAGPIRLPLVGRRDWETWNTHAGYQKVATVYFEVGWEAGEVTTNQQEGKGPGQWGEEI